MAEVKACKVCNINRHKFYGLAVTSLDQLKIKGWWFQPELSKQPFLDSIMEQIIYNCAFKTVEIENVLNTYV